MNIPEESKGYNPWEKVSDRELVIAVDALKYPYGGVENAADIVREELKILAQSIYSLRSQPSNKRIITLEGAARSGKSSKTYMLEEVFNSLNIKTVSTSCQSLGNEEDKQIEVLFRTIEEDKPSIIFIDEVMTLTPKALLLIREKYPDLIIIMTMGYDVRKADVFSIQQKWQDLFPTNTDLEPTKFISNFLWSRAQVENYVNQARVEFYKKSDILRDDFLDNLDDEGWEVIAKVCNVVSLGQPYLLSLIIGYLTAAEWSESFDQLGKDELYAAGRYLLKEIEELIIELSREPTSDGKTLLTGVVDAREEKFDDGIVENFESTLDSLKSALEDIISPQSFQHLYSQMLLKMVDIADLVLEIKK